MHSKGRTKSLEGPLQKRTPGRTGSKTPRVEEARLPLNWLVYLVEIQGVISAGKLWIVDLSIALIVNGFRNAQ